MTDQWWAEVEAAFAKPGRPPIVLPADGTRMAGGAGGPTSVGAITAAGGNGGRSWEAGEQAFFNSLAGHAGQVIAGLGSAGFMATEEPGRTQVWVTTEPHTARTPMRKVPSLADRRRDWVAGTITVDEWIAAVDAATLADLDGLPAAPWHQPWWMRVAARVLTALTGHRR